jgi:hypothetical protein
VSKDIRSVLTGWDYDPDRISVRIVKGDDGKDKIQLRLDLGILQMEFNGRPDGERPGGADSWFDYYVQKQRQHDAEHPDRASFRLESEDCVRLLREGVQYYHRYLSFWHLERYELCARDTQRNLRLFAFIREFARHDRDKLQFDQWRPYVTMMHARAVATPLVEMRDYTAAFGAIDAGIAGIKSFLQEYGQAENEENCAELSMLVSWRAQLEHRQSDDASKAYRPPEPRQLVDDLKDQLQTAIQEERFEEAARLRDQIKQVTRGPSGFDRESL